MTNEKLLKELQDKMLLTLKEKIPADLCYHNYEHTVDVLEATERIARGENVTDDELALLRTAAVFHDSGYIYSRDNHEERSCAITTEMLSSRGIDKETISQICDLILSTKVPHHPKNKLGEILCDADLDYLGRDDYFSISEKVFNEFKNFGIVKNENDWREMQIKFLGSHHYFTPTAKNSRDRKKEEHLSRIKSGVVI